MRVAIEQREIPDSDEGTDATVRAMLDLIAKGARSPAVCALARQIDRFVPLSRDRESRAYALIAELRRWMVAHWRFVDDPDEAELLYAADTQLALIDRRGVMDADCDDAAILFGAIGVALGLEVRIVCVGFLTPDAPFTHTWAELKPPSEGSVWLEGDVTRPMQAIPVDGISRVGVWEIEPTSSEVLRANQSAVCG